MGLYLGLAALGLFVGALGTLIGAGGGFILAPLLTLMYPHEEPETIASISLCVVFFNALGGSIAYARQKRIDYRSGLIFAAAAMPGAVGGAFLAAWIPRIPFEVTLGVVLILGAGLLILNPRRKPPAGVNGNSPPATDEINPPTSLATGPRNNDTARFAMNIDHATVSDDAENHNLSPHPPRRMALGALLSTAVGVLSSLLGIGGGIIHVPMLTHLLAFPVHVATATSHFVLALTALTGTLTHVLNGSFQHGHRRAAALAVGVLIGAPIGACLSARLKGNAIIRALAVALALVGARILAAAVQGQ